MFELTQISLFLLKISTKCNLIAKMIKVVKILLLKVEIFFLLCLKVQFY